MKKSKFWLLVLMLLLSLCLAVTLTACGGLGGGKDSGDGYDDGDTKEENEITISIEPSAEIGTSAELTLQANFAPFLHWERKYEFVENTCEAEFVHNQVPVTYEYKTAVKADKVGFATIKVSYITEDGETVESNTVKIEFYSPKIQISTAEDLKKLADSSEDFSLENDVDLSEIENWTPIEGFNGTLDGKGFSIKNLKISSVNGKNLGLFGTLSGSINNLKIENAYISAPGVSERVGIVAGTCSGTLSEVSVSGEISTEYYTYVGGIIGVGDCGQIINCTSSATLKGAGYVGGMAGYFSINRSDAITGCKNEGSVNGEDNVGGIVGYLTCPSQQGHPVYQIVNNENSGTVKGKNKVGGIFGQMYGMAYHYTFGISNDWYYGYFEISVLNNSGEVIGASNGSDVGGLVGNATRLTSVTACKNSGNVTGGSYVGGFLGNAPAAKIMASNFENKSVITGKKMVGGFAGQAGIIEKAVNSGEIVYTGISDAEDAYIGGIAGYCTGVIGCINNSNISAPNSGKYVGGIAGFTLVSADNQINDNINYGAITGGNCVGGIAGYITTPQQRSNTTYVVANNENKNNITGKSNVGGIFGEVFGMSYHYTGGISNDWYYGYFDLSVLLNSGEVTGDQNGANVGGLVGNATRLSVMTVCENKGDVSGGDCVGGFVGYAPGTNIKAIKGNNYCKISGKSKVGGFAGHAGIIEKAVNNGNIILINANKDKDAFIGGIAGYCNGVIGCTNNSNIKCENAGKYVGGIAGFIEVSGNDRVNDNINYGAITGTDIVGGISGYITAPQQRANPTYTLSNNENRNSVTGKNNIGGIFGEVFGMSYHYTGGIRNDWHYSYFEMSLLTNSGEITGDGNNVGGLVGIATRLNSLTACENKGNVLGGEYVGGLLGYAPGTNIKAPKGSNYNSISGKYMVGGFAGYAAVIENAINYGAISLTSASSSSDAYLGGIAGFCTGVVGCTNNADIKIPNAGKYIGGIAGYVCISTSNMVNNNENQGAIEGGDCVGGIVGYLTSAQTASNPTLSVSANKNKGPVNGVNKVGGIFGEICGMSYYYNHTQYYGYFEVTYCVNEAEITGTSYVGGVIGAHTRLNTDSSFMDTNTTHHGEKLGA